MKKRTFFQRLLLSTVAVAGFVACEQDLSSNQDGVSEAGASEREYKTFGRPIIDGRAVNVGYGYDIASNAAKRVALDETSYSVIENQNIVNPVEVVFESIETKEQFERVISGGVSVKGSGTVKQVNLGGSLDFNFKNEIKINKNTLNVMVRLRYAVDRYVINGTPKLTPEASSLLQENFGQFNNKYGLFYVADNTLGGEVFYLYTYDFSSVEKYTKAEVRAAINASLMNLFNIEGGGNLTVEQKKITEEAFTYSKQYSRVKGFSPSSIKTLREFEDEKVRLSNYVKDPSNVNNLASLDKTLVSYGDIEPDEKFDYRIVKLLKCQKSYEAWSKLFEEVKQVYFTSTDSELLRKSDEALQSISSKMSKLRRFVEVGNPTSGLYFDIVKEWKNTVDPKFIGVPVYLYPEGGVNTGRKFLSCTADGLSVHLWTHDEHNGRQQWIIQKVNYGTDKQYYTISAYGGVNGDRKYLSSTAGGLFANLSPLDNTDPAQRWGVKLLDASKNTFQIHLDKGVNNRKRILSCSPSGINVVGLWSRDDNSGRQKWVIKLANVL